ncbi:MAG: Ni/Fe hydrogenase subunit alpha [Rubrivivax sp.]|nr:Ni/Fe hydrogenase subunit alpha [Rubrivivax sp.]
MTELSTSASAGLRRVAIDPLSRVEGHGKVTLLLDDANRVKQARLHIVEFRGFEAFIVGRPYWEVPVMVQRLCGICPVSHHLAASKALDAALGVHAPPAAQALRRLMHHAQMLQSHALHFFHLSSPDLLFGFDSELEQRNLMAVAQAWPEVARQGVLLRQYGQELIEMTAGKKIHGTGSIPGGMNRRPDAAQRREMQARLPQIIGWCEAAVDLVARLHAAEATRYDAFGAAPAAMMSLVDEQGTLDLYDGRLRLCEADGQVAQADVDAADYLALIDESVRPWSYMKFPYRRSRGEADGWYRVGPLARLQVAQRLGTPRAEARRQAWRAEAPGGPAAIRHGVLATHTARMIEMLHAAEVIGQLLDDESWAEGELCTPPPARRAGEGVGIIEAPRGTLIHHYRIGADDLVQWCNLIVSTTHNNQAMHEAIRVVADQYFDGRELSEGLLNHIEVAIRAYDPCLSCATHALGAMPLELNLVDGAGRAQGGLRRDGDGRLQRLLPDGA